MEPLTLTVNTEDYITRLEADVKCPDCEALLGFDDIQTPFLAGQGVVIIPLLCYDCGSGAVIELIIPSTIKKPETSNDKG